MPRLRQACPPCHQRKVKCDIAQVEMGLCSNCVKRGLQCPGAEEIPPRKKRRGAKVDALDALYAGSPSSGSSELGAATATTPPHVELLHTGVAPAGAAPISRTESSLVKMELAGEFARTMISECHITHDDNLVKHLLPDCGLREFTNAGQRFSGMESSISEIIARCYVALGARHTSHPAIVGTLAPNLRDPSGMFIVGTRRENACRDLARVVLERYDELALWRKPTLAALQAAAFVYVVVRSVSAEAARPIVAAAIDNARRLVDSPDTNPKELDALRGRGAIPLLWIDSFAAAECGSLPCLTNQDFEELFPSLIEIMGASWDNGKEELAVEGTRFRLCRDFATNIHRPFRRQVPLDSAKVSSFLDDLEYHQTRCYERYLVSPLNPEGTEGQVSNALRQNCSLILMTVDMLQKTWTKDGDVNVLMLHVRSESLARQALKIMATIVDKMIVSPRNTTLAVRTFGILEVCPQWVEIAVRPSSQPGEALTVQEQSTLFQGLQLAGWGAAFAEKRLAAFLAASQPLPSIDSMIGSHVATMAAQSPFWGTTD